MAVPRARLLDLMKLQCQIFSTTYNPDRLRLGNKVLRQRLRGPALASYYPPRGIQPRDIDEAFKEWPLVFYDQEKEEWLDKIHRVHARGKGAPKKGEGATKKKKK